MDSLRISTDVGSTGLGCMAQLGSGATLAVAVGAARDTQAMATSAARSRLGGGVTRFTGTCSGGR